MATFLRFLSGLIGFLYAQAALVGGVLALVTAKSRSGSAGAPLLLAGGVVLLMVTGVTIGALVSYLRFEEPESRRHLRRRLVVLGASGVLGAVLQVASIAFGVPAWFAVASTVVGLLLVPAQVALGRAARRRDSRRTQDDAIGRVAREVRRGYRLAAIGFAVGLVAGTLLIVVLTVVLGSHRGVDEEAVVLTLTLACIGASVGALAAQLRISPIVREVVGPEYAQVRRIARVVLRGKGDPLSDQERASAATYARVISGFLTLQAVAFALLYIGLVLNEVGQVVNDRRHDPVPIVLLPVFVVLILVFAVLMVLRIRRARAYAAAHPVAEPV